MVKQKSTSQKLLDKPIYITLSAKTITGELAEVEFVRKDCPCCGKCGSLPEDHEIINYERICHGWNKGDVRCKKCGSFVRNNVEFIEY
ncbi:TPA: hypothetical protein DCZ46_01555 [Candidatus Campbellbacteria bacterium]|nr:MAG: hypothetical protein UR58_C0001G0282 [Candidatus Campbellbacteria bacterium GW2011_OD1_34_28]KKP75232.1 MAG: hypothetical protein UR74_C0001G0088 [Candidatus Campbellbacteria bacterium GW2011_GWD2_35_24]KKP76207.1 MAG: hypothetical protein UR75_C0001G0241 [Candidatus Campbellbacteria bacterium GW2011_GWC2_35_28]KKP77396.1 MAG: hypothetical protein UR76_C0001G0241 [Candidatus Campbellbacteria bacterium GW2011_GWC1_35_31]KKP79325.1 MAG: hypothetical protein UR79_C0001G0241 [Candidatus Cam